MSVKQPASLWVAPWLQLLFVRWAQISLTPKTTTTFVRNFIQDAKTPQRKMKDRQFGVICIVISCFAAGIVTVCAALLFSIYSPTGWRGKVRGLATMLAVRDAKSNYSKGLLGIYTLSIGQDDTERYTGTNIGRFQAWALGCHENYGMPNRSHLETYAEVYNRTARRLDAENDRIKLEAPDVDRDTVR